MFSKADRPAAPAGGSTTTTTRTTFQTSFLYFTELIYNNIEIPVSEFYVNRRWGNSSVGNQSCVTPPRHLAVRLDPTCSWYVRVLDSTSRISLLRASEESFKRRVFDASKGTREACLLDEQFCWHPVLLDPALLAVRPDPNRSWYGRVLDSKFCSVGILSSVSTPSPRRTRRSGSPVRQLHVFDILKKKLKIIVL